MNLKRLLSVFLLVALVIMTTACGSKTNTETSSVSPTTLADDMLKALNAQGELIEVSSNVVSNYYELDADVVNEYKIYISTSFIAEEVAVFKIAKKSDADKVKSMIEKRILDLKETFTGYLPEELDTLEQNATILTNGDIVAFVTRTKEGVAAATEVFNNAFEK